MVEVGPGRVLTNLVTSILGPKGVPCLAIESKPGADRDSSTVLGALFAGRAIDRIAESFAGRLVRPFVPASERRFITNPCELPFPETARGRTSRPPPKPRNVAALGGADLSRILADYFAQNSQVLADMMSAHLSGHDGHVGAPNIVRPSSSIPPPPSIV